MITSTRVDSLVSLRWTARVLAAASITVLLLFLVGEGLNPAEIREWSWVLFALFPVGIVIGLALGWWRELIGGLTVALCLGAFYLLHRLLDGSWPRGAAFLVFAFPGVLFLGIGLWKRLRGSV